MREHNLSLVRGFVFLAGMAASSVAWALPWHIDMADAEMFKAYEREMAGLPEGVMSQQNLLTPIAYRRNYARGSEVGEALTNPLDSSDAAVLERGERMYGVYCTPCHGDGVNLGPVAQPGRYPAVAVLAGDGGRLQHVSDGWVYLTLRNGGGLMPAYGHAMNDDEMWSVVAWMRATLPNAAAPVPEPPAEAPSEETPQ